MRRDSSERRAIRVARTTRKQVEHHRHDTARPYERPSRVTVTAALSEWAAEYDQDSDKEDEIE